MPLPHFLLILRKASELRTKALAAGSVERRSGGKTFLFRPDAQSSELFRRDFDWGELIDSGVRLKNNRITSASIVTLPSGERLFMKRATYWKKKWHQGLRYLVQPSRAYLNWVGADMLDSLGIPTPKVLALGDERRWGVPIECWIAMEVVEDVRQLRAYVQSAELSPDFCAELLTKLGTLARRMHAGGLYHGDLGLPNIYLDREGKLGLWDLDGIKVFEGEVPAKWARRDVGRIYSSFLLELLANPGHTGLDFDVRKGAEILCGACDMPVDPILSDLQTYWLRGRTLPWK